MRKGRSLSHWKKRGATGERRSRIKRGVARKNLFVPAQRIIAWAELLLPPFQSKGSKIKVGVAYRIQIVLLDGFHLLGRQSLQRLAIHHTRDQFGGKTVEWGKILEGIEIDET